MTLPLPKLDQRSWSDLVAEGLARIPRHAPEWTDHNAHDPGVTLIELLAYKTEQVLYQVNRVSRRLVRNVNRHLTGDYDLAGGHGQPDVPRSVLWFSPVAEAKHLEQKLVFESMSPGDDSQAFSPRLLRLLDAIDLLPVKLLRVQDAAGDLSQALYSGGGVVLSVPAPSAAVKRQPLFSLHLEQPDQPGRQAQHVGPGQRDMAESSCGEPSQLGIYFEIASDGPEPATSSNRTDAHPVQLRWTWRNSASGAEHEATPEPGDDGTASLSQSGVVRLRVRSDVTEINCYWEDDVPWPAGRRFRRIVVNAARAEHVTEWRASRIETSQLATDRDGFQFLDVFRSPNMFLSVRLSPSRDLSQTSDVRDAPTNWRVVVSESWQVGTPWQECTTLLASDMAERCFEVEDSVVRFGNGKHGAKLPADGFIDITCDILQPIDGIAIGTRWRAHDEQLRDVMGTTISAPVTPHSCRDQVAKVQRPLARLEASARLRVLASENDGTLDGLPLPDVLAIPTPDVAVIATDYERIALGVPGLRIVRARAVENVDVRAPGMSGTGTISVVVLPDMQFAEFRSHTERKALPASHVADQPIWPWLDGEDVSKTSQPRDDGASPTRKTVQRRLDRVTEAAMNRVREHLFKYRSLGTNLVVTAPRLSLIGISLTIDGSVPSQDAITNALQVLFDPITGGPRGAGYPWGRTPTSSEVIEWLRRKFSDDSVVACQVTAITKCFPWSMPCPFIRFVQSASTQYGAK